VARPNRSRFQISDNPAQVRTAIAMKRAATVQAIAVVIVAAGEQVIASKNPVAIGQNLACALFNAGGLILFMVMLRSGIFSTRTAWLGILFNTFALGFPLEVGLAPGNQIIPGAAWEVAVIFWVFWYIGIARAFARLARGRRS
jgi:hypothetical protein